MFVFDNQSEVQGIKSMSAVSFLPSPLFLFCRKCRWSLETSLLSVGPACPLSSLPGDGPTAKPLYAAVYICIGFASGINTRDIFEGFFLFAQVFSKLRRLRFPCGVFVPSSFVDPPVIDPSGSRRRFPIGLIHGKPRHFVPHPRIDPLIMGPSGQPVNKWGGLMVCGARSTYVCMYLNTSLVLRCLSDSGSLSFESIR